VIGQSVLELNSELLNNNTESGKSSLDVLSLLILKGQDTLLNWTKSLLGNFLKLGFVSLKSYQEVFLHLDLMLLHEHNGLFHWVDLFEGFLFNHLDITQVSHDGHKLGFFSFRLVRLGHNFDAFADVVNELIDVLDLAHCVVK